MKILTVNCEETKKVGQLLAKKFLTSPLKKKAFIIGMEGELGGGKTTFVQGFAGGIGIREKILSPTFVILKRFKITKLKYKNFYHIDCYRTEKLKDILELGFKEIISNPENIVAIEWADRIKKILPKDTFWIKFKFLDKEKRQIIFNK